MNTKLTVSRNTGLAKVEKPLSPELSKKETEIIKASRSAFCYKLIEQGDPEVDFLLIRSLNQFTSRTGFVKSEQADENLQTEIIAGMTDAVEVNRWMKVQELELILKRGMIGEFGDFHGLNGRTLNGWIKTYFDRERTEAMKKQMKFDQEQQEEADKARKEANMKLYTGQQRERFVGLYNRLKKELKTPITWSQVPQGIDIGNIWYEKFWKAGIQRIDRATYDRYVSEAERNLRGDELTRHLDGEGRKRRAEAKARSRVLREKIADLLNSNQDIEEILNFVGL